MRGNPGRQILRIVFLLHFPFSLCFLTVKNWASPSLLPPQLDLLLARVDFTSSLHLLLTSYFVSELRDIMMTHDLEHSSTLEPPLDL